MIKRVFLIVLDSFGIGELPDAAEYGDTGSNTLEAVCRSQKLCIPNLKRLGLFNIDGVTCAEATENPLGQYGRMAEISSGKDTTTGHWEIAGIKLDKAFPTFGQGFPPQVLKEISAACGRGIICNRVYSGTKVIADYGKEHLKTGDLIVYTSADSVLQIAAHEDIVPPRELYEICLKARKIMQGEYAVGRIIARPFTGEYPFERTPNRRDFSLVPTGRTMLDNLAENSFDVIGVGKISDIFAEKGITRKVESKNNAQGMQKTIALLKEKNSFNGLCFVNLVDFDMLYGHRNDVDGYANALSEFDSSLGEFLSLMDKDDLLMITADHGCDPSTPSTDHSREYVPLLVVGEAICKGVNLGTRRTFSDIAATIQNIFGLDIDTHGTSFNTTLCN